MIDYYSRRVREYEDIYAKPERQADLERLRRLIPQKLAGHVVLEVACGTGYWTQLISKTARSILATDLSDEMLQAAGRKSYGPATVRFAKADAFTLAGIDGLRAPSPIALVPLWPPAGSVALGTAAFAGFFWSHVPLGRISAFLAALHSKLPAGARVVLADNNFVAGSNTPIARIDEEGNNYQTRILQDGSTFEVIKNFPSEVSLRQALSDFADDLDYLGLDYYWCVTYRVRAKGGRCRT